LFYFFIPSGVKIPRVKHKVKSKRIITIIIIRITHVQRQTYVDGLTSIQ